LERVIMSKEHGLPWVKLYPADFSAALQGLTDSDIGKAVRLYLLYATTGRPIASESLALRFGNEADRAELILDSLPIFKRLDDGRWVASSVYSQIEAYDQRCQTNAENAKKPRKPQSQANGEQIASESLTNPSQEQAEPEPNREPNQEPRTKNISPSNEGEEREPRPAPRKKPAAALNFYGLPENLVADWVRSRGSKKLTQTAIDGVKREAEKAKLSFEEAVRMMLESGWQGFRASWDSVRRTNSVPEISQEDIDRSSAWSAYIKPYVDKVMRPPLSYDEWLDKYEREHHQGPYRNLSAEDQFALQGDRA
jgi:uncharacterized protein YdaU (DUF1376 family)